MNAWWIRESLVSALFLAAFAGCVLAAMHSC
jgi:hypothetical protein